MGFLCPNCNVVFELKKCTCCRKYKMRVEFDISPRTHKPLPQCQECRTLLTSRWINPPKRAKICLICYKPFWGRKWRRVCSEICEKENSENLRIKQRLAEKKYRKSHKNKISKQRQEKYRREKALIKNGAVIGE